MKRAISIVLIVATALQTVGCSSWRPLARTNEVSEDNRQASMRDQILSKLTEGMRVRIRMREGTYAPPEGQVIECVIEEVGLASLAVSPRAYSVHANASRMLTLRYADIESIEYRESGGVFAVLVAGLGVGAILGLLLFTWALSGVEFD